MMYYAGWLVLVSLSLGVSLVAFLWGLRSGQFSDPERARYLPLGRDLLSQPASVAPARRRRAQSVALLAIVFLGIAAFAAALGLSLLHR